MVRQPSDYNYTDSPVCQNFNCYTFTYYIVLCMKNKSTIPYLQETSSTGNTPAQKRKSEAVEDSDEEPEDDVK